MRRMYLHAPFPFPFPFQCPFPRAQVPLSRLEARLHISSISVERLVI